MVKPQQWWINFWRKAREEETERNRRFWLLVEIDGLHKTMGWVR